jgi:hypothetical protein
VQHFLFGNEEDGRSPSLDGLELLLGQPLVDRLFERESGEEVLAHEGVFELRRRAQHVDERFAVLNDEGSLFYDRWAPQLDRSPLQTTDGLRIPRRLRAGGHDYKITGLRPVC